MANVKHQRRQRGGFGVGVVVGLVVGLALALGVALWVTKSPVPFVEKVQGRTQEQDAAEAERNRNWDPNSPLYGKGATKAPAASEPTTVTSSGSVTPAVTAPVPAVAASDLLPDNEASLPPLPGDGGALPPLDRDAVPMETPAKRAVPKPDTSKAEAKATKVDPAASTETSSSERYLVQVGAYTSSADAEQQRAKLAMNGLSAKISERERDGKVFYRVRLGSYKSEEAENVRKQVSAIGYREAALVRVTSK